MNCNLEYLAYSRKVIDNFCCLRHFEGSDYIFCIGVGRMQKKKIYVCVFRVEWLTSYGRVYTYAKQ